MSEIDTVRRYIQAKPQLRQRTKRTDVESALDSLLARLAAVEAERDDLLVACEDYREDVRGLTTRARAAEARVEALTRAITHVIRDSPPPTDSVKTFLSRALSSLPSGPLTPEPEQEGPNG